MSPSYPIEQANGFCHRTYYPATWSTCVRGLCRPLATPPRQISFRTEDVAGRINPRDFRRNFLAGRGRGGAPETHSTTAPEVCTRRLTRGNGPRERSVPKFFPSALYHVFPLRAPRIPEMRPRQRYWRYYESRQKSRVLLPNER